MNYSNLVWDDWHGCELVWSRMHRLKRLKWMKSHDDVKELKNDVNELTNFFKILP